MEVPNDNNELDRLLKEMLLNEDHSTLSDEQLDALSEQVFAEEPVITPSPEKEKELIDRLVSAQSGGGGRVVWLRNLMSIAAVLLVGTVAVYMWPTSEEAAFKDVAFEEAAPLEAPEDMEVNAEEGTSGNSYEWSDAVADSAVTGLTSGTYAIELTDSLSTTIVTTTNGFATADADYAFSDETINQPGIDIDASTNAPIIEQADIPIMQSGSASSASDPTTYGWTSGDSDDNGLAMSDDMENQEKLEERKRSDLSYYADAPSNTTTAAALDIETNLKKSKVAAPTYNERIFVQTDKQVYRAGEQMQLAAYLRNENNLLANGTSEVLHVQLSDSRGRIYVEEELLALDGTAQGEVNLANYLQQGTYTLRAFTNWQKNFSRAAYFETQVQVIPTNITAGGVDLVVNYDKDSYRAGDKVSAEIAIADKNGSTLKSKYFKYALFVNGVKYLENEATTKQSGLAKVDLKLPTVLKSDNVRLNIAIPYQKAIESYYQNVPISGSKVNFVLTAESGPLVTGLNTRVVVEARDEYDRPQQLNGILTDGKGIKHSFSTSKEGQALVALDGTASNRMDIALADPMDARKTSMRIPPVQTAGASLMIDATGNDRYTVQISTTKRQTLTLKATVRGNVTHKQQVKAMQMPLSTIFDTRTWPGGVAHVELIDADNKVVAHRPFYVRHSDQLDVQLSKVSSSATGTKVAFQITDEGKPVNGTFTVSAVTPVPAEELLQGSITSELLLEAELNKEVTNGSTYFANSAETRKALDLLLITQAKALSSKSYKDHSRQMATLTGTVFNRSGTSPLSNVQIDLLGENLQASTSNNGQFEFRPIDVTAYQDLRVTYKGYAHQVRVSPLANDIRIKLPGVEVDQNIALKNGELRLQIVNQKTLKPLANATLTANGRPYTSDNFGYISISEEGPINVTANIIGYISKEGVYQSGSYQLQLEENLTALELDVVSGDLQPKRIEPTLSSVSATEIDEPEEDSYTPNPLLIPAPHDYVMEQLDWVRQAFDRSEFNPSEGSLRINTHYNTEELYANSRNKQSAYSNSYATNKNFRTTYEKGADQKLLVWLQHVEVRNGTLIIALPADTDLNNVWLSIQGITNNGITGAYMGTAQPSAERSTER